MKVQRLHLGQADNGLPFYLYQIPTSTSSDHSRQMQPFYQIDVLEALFCTTGLQLLDHVPRQYFETEECYYYKGEDGKTYLLAQAIGEAAIKLNKYLLAEICKMKREDILTGVAHTLLEGVRGLARAENYAEDETEMTLIPAIKSVDLLVIKPEPESPPPNQLDTSLNERCSKRRYNNPMSVDQLVSEQAQDSDEDSLKRRRLGTDNSDRPQSARYKKSAKSEERIQNGQHRQSDPSSNSDIPTIGHLPLLPRPNNQNASSLLSKRFTQRSNKNARNLTIYTPSYAEQYALGIKSAPLHATHQNSAHSNNSHKASTDSLHPRQAQHTLAPLLSPRAPIVASQSGMRSLVNPDNMGPKSAANAGHFPSIHHSTTSSPRKSEFPIPPVVPSQQLQHYQNVVPIPSLYGPKSARSASDHTPNVPTISTPGTAAAATMPPKTPTTTSFASLQKQTFLQPFEHLFENIEITRTLKSTLDDQVRRSSSLLQSLQSHNSMVENMVKSHMKEIQREISEKIDQKFDEIIQRISTLEGTSSSYQGSPSSSSASPALNGSKSNSVDAVRHQDTLSKKKKNQIN